MALDRKPAARLVMDLVYLVYLLSDSQSLSVVVAKQHDISV